MELFAEDRKKVLKLLKNNQHELTVISVIHGESPGNVYVDNINTPKTFFIKTPECNMVGGDASVSSFNSELKEHIDYFDSIVCDTDQWAEVIKEIHRNCALKKYLRKYLRHVDKTEVRHPLNFINIEFIYDQDLNTLQYENKEVVQDWIKILRAEDRINIPLAAVVIKNNTIVSCSAIDCIHRKAVEIGIKTLTTYRRKGYAAFAVSSLINKLYEAGINNIGWHCMSSNAGSIKTALKCGFKEEITYDSFYPYPPIENATDLSIEEWYKLGTYYEEKGNTSADQHWQAARCFAHSRDEKHVISCINKLIEKKQLWFLEYIDECDEFDFIVNNNNWIKLILEAKRNDA